MAQCPNILWIVVDALRWDHLSCYGYHRQTSPNIDRLAAEGVLYKQAFAQANYSLPSYATMLTGLYPHEHCVERVDDRLNDAVVTLPTELNDIGYETICITANAYVGAVYGLHRGFSQHSYTWQKQLMLKGGLRQHWHRALQSVGLVDQGARRATYLARQAMQNCTKPWFMFLVYMETHEPYSPPLGFISKFHAGLHAGITHPFFALWSGNTKRAACTASYKQWERIKALYDAEIAYTDYCIGQLLTSLADWKVLDHTIVIITADHGEFMGERGLGGHAFGVGEALLHVPLIIRYPPAVASGTVVDSVVELRDIPYTLSTIGGADFQPQSAYGARNLLVPSPNDRPFAYARRRRQRQLPARRWLGSFDTRKWARQLDRYNRDIDLLRTRHYQFRQYGNGEVALYNAEKDPTEQHNVAKARPQITEQLRQTLEDFLAQVHSAPSPQPTEPVTPDYTEAERKAVEQRLKELGYL